MLGGTHSHGTGHVASGVEDQVRDAVLILVAPIPERDLAGRQDSRVMLRAPGRAPQAAGGPGHLVITGGTGGHSPKTKQQMAPPEISPLTKLSPKLAFQLQLQAPVSSTVPEPLQLPAPLRDANHS